MKIIVHFCNVFDLKIIHYSKEIQIIFKITLFFISLGLVSLMPQYENLFFILCLICLFWPRSQYCKLLHNQTVTVSDDVNVYSSSLIQCKGHLLHDASQQFAFDLDLTVGQMMIWPPSPSMFENLPSRSNRLSPILYVLVLCFFSGMGWDQVSSHSAERDGWARCHRGTVLLLQGEREAHRQRPRLRQPHGVCWAAEGKTSHRKTKS